MLSLSPKGLPAEWQLLQPAAAHRETSENRGVQLQQDQRRHQWRRRGPDLQRVQEGQQVRHREDRYHVLSPVRLQPVQELGGCGHLRCGPRVQRGAVQRNVLQKPDQLRTGGGQRLLHLVQQWRTGSPVHHVSHGQGHHEGGAVGQVLLFSVSTFLLTQLKGPANGSCCSTTCLCNKVFGETYVWIFFFFFITVTIHLFNHNFRQTGKQARATKTTCHVSADIVSDTTKV